MRASEENKTLKAEEPSNAFVENVKKEMRKRRIGHIVTKRKVRIGHIVARSKGKM